MKNYIYRLSCLALMGLALTACNDDGFDSPRPSKNNKKGINFTVESFVPESITRMAYDETATGDLIPTLTANDVIAVWGMRNGLTEKVQFRLDADNINADGSANFDGGLWRLRSDETRYAAFYPYNGSNCDNDQNWDTGECTYYQWVNYDDQWYDASLDAYASLGDRDYLFCAAQQADEEGNVNFAMQHVGAVVSAHLYGLPAGAYVRSLTDEEFVSQGKILMEGTDITIADPQMTKSLTINCNNLNVAEAGDVYVYFMCPPVDLTNKEITFRVNVGGMLYKGTNIYTSNKDVVAGSYKKLSCKNLAMSGTAVTLGEDTPVQEGESYYFIPAEDGVYALSAEVYCWFEDAPQIYDPQTGESYPYLRKDQVYPVMYYDWDVPSSFVVTQKDYAILPLGEEYTVEEGKSYLLSIAEEDLYELTSPDGSVTHMMGNNWDCYLPYCEYFSEGFDFVYFDASGTVKISKPQVAELTLDEPVTVTAGTVYKLSITEEGLYQFESENGNNYCRIKQFTEFWMPYNKEMPIGDWYVSFDNDDVVKISKLSYIDLPLNETVQVVAGKIYKMDVTEEGYYQFEGTPGMYNSVEIIDWFSGDTPFGCMLYTRNYYVKFINDDEVKVSCKPIVDITLGQEVDVVPGTAYRYNTGDFHGYVRLSGSEGVTHCQSNNWGTFDLPSDVEVWQWYDCIFTFDEMGKFMLSEATYESLPATGTVTVTAGATYTYQCDEPGMYTFASAKAGNKVNVLNWGNYENDLPLYQIFNPGDIYRLRFIESDEITITKVEDEALQVGQNNVADGKWYSFTASEDFAGFVSFENFGYDWSSIGPGYQYYFGGSTNYIHVTEATADAAITITPADDVYQTAIAVEPGTEYDLDEGQWYSIYIEAYRNIQLDETLDNAIRGVMMYSEYGSFDLSADWPNSHWASAAWYFQAPSSGKIKFDYVD